MARDLTIRPLTSRDEALLFDMLYLAIYVPEGSEPPPPDVVHGEALSKYVAGFGRDGDLGFVAIATDQDMPLGAAWLRRFTERKPGYGFVNIDTPELTIAVAPTARNRGIGKTLLRALLDAAGERFCAVSLSIWPTNPAIRLYRRFGFEIVSEEDPAVTMVKRLC